MITAPRRQNLVESSNSQLLHQLFKALPEEHRVSFLKEVIGSLSEDQREELIAQLEPDHSKIVAQTRVENGDLSPKPFKPAATPLTKSGEKEPTNEQKLAMAEAQFKQFSMQTGMAGDGKAKIRRQFWSCLGIGVLAIAVLILLAVGTRFLFDYARSTLTTEMSTAAQGDLPVAGDVEGDYTHTQGNDGVYQEITELESGGRLAKRHSYLEHKWQMDVVGGQEVAFLVKAYKSSTNEEQGFVFSWSRDDHKYIDMLTINNTVDHKEYQSARLPSLEDGKIFIRVRDTNRDRGDREKDTLYVDHLFIRSK